MKNFPTKQIRNIALLGNAGSGKTTLAEALLFEGGVIDRRGDVDNKNTVSDYNNIEQENGSSIYLSVLYSEYNNNKINILDTSGSDDFVGAVAVGSYASLVIGILFWIIGFLDGISFGIIIGITLISTAILMMDKRGQ